MARPNSNAAASSGLLVLGMHRSGTSVLSRTLHLGGADIGSRIVEASAGNEGGHWEDAFALEVHERLFAQLGRSWDELLPIGEESLAEADDASERLIGEYLRMDRAKHPLWAVKDPRLCVFGAMWRRQAAAAGIPLGAIVVLRHPWEVAGSLAARDGIPASRALLLWLRYTVGALLVADGLPTAVVSYAAFLQDWRAALAPVGRLPGGQSLHWDKAAQAKVDRFVDAGQRHHHVQDDTVALPALAAELWQALDACARTGAAPQGLAQRFSLALARAHELIDPLLVDFRLSERKLWERVGRAESALVQAPAGSVEGALSDLSGLVQAQHQNLVHAISEDIRRMQEMVAKTGKQAAASEARALALQQQAQDARAQYGAAVEQARARYEADLELTRVERQAAVEARAAQEAEIEQLRMSYESELKKVHASYAVVLAEMRAAQGTALESASGHITTMQEAVAVANRQASELHARASLAEQLKPAIESVSRHAELELAPRLGAISAELNALREERARISALEDEASQLREAQRRDAAVARDREEQLTAQFRQQLANLESQSLELRHSQDRVAALEHELRQGEQQALALQAELSASGQELDRARADARVLRMDSEKLERVLGTRSWRWSRPLRALARALRGHWGASDSLALRRAWQRLLGRSPTSVETVAWLGGVTVAPPAQVTGPMQRADQIEGLADVFVWAVIDWDFRFQRPQHLAKAMAQRGHRTFYISNNFVDSATPGFRADPLDGSGRLFQVNLHLEGAPAIYFGLPSEAQVEALRKSLAMLLAWTCTRQSLSVVQHPYWSSLVRAVPNARMVYDCMDHHAGFENNASSVLAAEHALLVDADLVIVTSLWLQSEVGPAARSCALVRNACEYEFFSAEPAERFIDPAGRKVIGYFGAIAEWFDLELLRKIARAYPSALVLLVGADTAGAREALAGEENVRFVGEVAYANLPYWLHGFDVALLPFRVIPLTLATNPVKLYEYLAAGKPVVAVDLPEMAQFGGLVRVASDHDGFVAAVGEAIAEPVGGALVRARQEFAAGQTWDHRARAVDEAIAAIEEPRVSVIVLTYNNLPFTEACLFSIESYSDYGNLEVIVVDNASSDGSREWLRDWEAQGSAAGHARRLILNDGNLGFSAGNNVGLRASTGDYLVILNNDTYVTPGWVRTLVAHFRREPRLGLVGPVTNNIGNEARIRIEYADMCEMIHNALQYTRSHPGASLRMRNAAFFCVAMPRRVYELVGDMDEAFGVGFFEDDDYCRRIDQAGYEIACAEDVFVHHHLSASFDKLKAGVKQELFERNKVIYEAKWGPWIPHNYRPEEERQV